MSRRAITAFLVPLAVLTAPGARAELAPGYSGQSSSPRDATVDEFWWSLADIGSCLAKSRKASAAKLLASSPGSSAESAALHEMIGRPTMCLRGGMVRMATPTHLLRGSLAEALYEQRIKKKASIDWLPGRAAALPATPAGDDGYLRSFARCYVAADAAEAHRLLTSTELATKEEGQAVVTMARAMKGCAPGQGKVALDATEIRLALAEALYHWLTRMRSTSEAAR